MIEKLIIKIENLIVEVEKRIPEVDYYGDIIAWLEAEGWARLEAVGHKHPPSRIGRCWYWITGKAMFLTAQFLFYVSYPVLDF